MVQDDIRKRQWKIILLGGGIQFPKILGDPIFYLTICSHLIGHHVYGGDPFRVANRIDGFQQTVNLFFLPSTSISGLVGIASVAPR